MRSKILLGLFGLGSILALGGCGSSTLGDGFPEKQNCSSCHGSEESFAPPEGVRGQTATTDIAVGAHQTHLKAGHVRGPVECSECHVVPASIEQQGHIDQLPAEVTFGELATNGGASPSWERQSATCSGVYCHGATLKGGKVEAPVWTR
ncbi:MAG: CxxxxCH/CxxCH domain-containing protein, partial [Deltaproteobacteria bacterium]